LNEFNSNTPLLNSNLIEKKSIIIKGIDFAGDYIQEELIIKKVEIPIFEEYLGKISSMRIRNTLAYMITQI
jgi:hypothetical protein